MHRRLFLKFVLGGLAALGLPPVQLTPRPPSHPELAPWGEVHRIYLPLVAQAPGWRLGMPGAGELGLTTVLGVDL